jgi:hypothetical protein
MVELRGPARSNDLKTLVCPTEQKAGFEAKRVSPRLSNRAAGDEEFNQAEIAEANQQYGALTEGFYVAGFTFGRAMTRVLGLMKTGHWAKVGGGFDDVNDFVRSLQLDQFKIVAEQRKEFVTRIKELQPTVSNRAIADALGVGKDRQPRG